MVWQMLLTWMYNSVYKGCADFFTLIGQMGAEIFDLAWVQATVHLFEQFGWALFVAGMIVSIFDLAVEYQNGKANIANTMLNNLKGIFACSLIGVVPVELYRFAISLQNTFSHYLANVATITYTVNVAHTGMHMLATELNPSNYNSGDLFNTLILIAFVYCVVKIFFQNIKRGGILLIQICIGSLYMFSVPRGYTEGFTQWIKQVIGTCITAFLQTTILYMGLLTFPESKLMGIGIMLAANEVPRLAQQFGVDSAQKFNIMSIVHATTTAINLTRIIKK